MLKSDMQDVDVISHPKGPIMRKPIARRIATTTIALVATATLSIGSATKVWAGKTSNWDKAPASSDRTSNWDSAPSTEGTSNWD